MEELLVKYWAGWLSLENMDRPEWLAAWKEQVQKAEEQDFELVIFRVPKKGRVVEEMERLLQDKFRALEDEFGVSEKK